MLLPIIVFSDYYLRAIIIPRFTKWSGSMWYIISIGSEPKFFRESESDFILVQDIKYTNTVIQGDRYAYFEPALPTDEKQADDVLFKNRVRGYPTKLAARQAAKELPLKNGTWKYYYTGEIKKVKP